MFTKKIVIYCCAIVFFYLSLFDNDVMNTSYHDNQVHAAPVLDDFHKPGPFFNFERHVFSDEIRPLFHNFNGYLEHASAALNNLHSMWPEFAQMLSGLDNNSKTILYQYTRTTYVPTIPYFSEDEYKKGDDNEEDATAHRHSKLSQQDGQQAVSETKNAYEDYDFIETRENMDFSNPKRPKKHIAHDVSFFQEQLEEAGSSHHRRHAGGQSEKKPLDYTQAKRKEARLQRDIFYELLNAFQLYHYHGIHSQKHNQESLGEKMSKLKFFYSLIDSTVRSTELDFDYVNLDFDAKSLSHTFFTVNSLRNLILSILQALEYTRDALAFHITEKVWWQDILDAEKRVGASLEKVQKLIQEDAAKRSGFISLTAANDQITRENNQR